MQALAKAALVCDCIATRVKGEIHQHPLASSASFGSDLAILPLFARIWAVRYQGSIPLFQADLTINSELFLKPDSARSYLTGQFVP